MVELPLARYRFRFSMHAALRLPEYAGSLLRGQFGAHLRALSCTTGAPRCDACPQRSACAYAQVFETPAPTQHSLQNFSHIPNPYVIEPPPLGARQIAIGEVLEFNIVLFGDALQQLPLIAAALRQALQGGLSKTRARGQLQAIAALDPQRDHWQTIWQSGNHALADHPTRYPLPRSTPATERITLQFYTPLRLQQQGQPVPITALTPRKLIADLLRRISLLAEFHAGQPALIPDVSALVRHAESLQHHHQLHWLDETRFSSRQQRNMPIGGASGRWVLEGELAPLLPWLELGQWLHVGKLASQGLGGYRLAA